MGLLDCLASVQQAGNWCGELRQASVNNCAMCKLPQCSGLAVGGIRQTSAPGPRHDLETGPQIMYSL